ncbi:hypothetical protein [Geodermatophilus sp. DSM 45219]|uniref:hypothetical protein n=1 Tax=Geodermatophilus sp. DSM 45219 TaxID=1881103 RepID=UPI0008876DCC|nr:hypothetical protein [Geodermatophilus sp. DSM 45219]SDN41758.1 hypothetical protein SAMN05428965_0308 [Geodermatophilus sp. DSM 45219]
MRCRTTAAAGVLFTAALSLGVSGTAHAADTYNCPDFVSQADAQAVYNANPSDPNQLDRDNDAQACEDHDYIASPGTVTSAMALGTTSQVTPGTTSQVTSRPAGAVAAGDGSSSGGEASALPYVLGGVALTAAGGAAFAARRSSRATV